MGAQGAAVLDFGAFPGSNVATVDVNTAGVVATSAVEAWIRPVASADHTDADHIVAPMKVTAVFLSNDNIRIYGVNLNDVMPPLEPQPYPGEAGLGKLRPPYNRLARQNAPMFVGQFNVWWVWN
jgi:hypothetical protein